MKKLLGIVILSLLLSGKSYSATATCFAGTCEFFLGLWYEYAETNCMDNLNMEEVEQEADEEAGDVDDAPSEFGVSFDSVISASKCESSTKRSFRKNEKDKIKINSKINLLKSHNKYKESYCHDGQWFWINVTKFLKSKKIIGNNTGLVLIPSILSQDINTLSDWKKAEAKFMFSKKKQLRN